MLCIEHNKPVVYKDSDTMGRLIFKEVDKQLAKDLILTNHYSHKWASNFGIINVGVFRESEPDKCLGVASFGWMMFPRAYKTIASNIGREEIIELNRLWIDDCLGKNTETMLLSASFKILKYYKKIRLVQSFADGRLGCGTIYKASNFKYYGKSETGFLRHLKTGEIFFGAMFTKTPSPITMLYLVTEFCKGDMELFHTYSYRYLYKLDKTVDIILKEEPFPEYQKGEVLYDCNKFFTGESKSTQPRGFSGGVVRGYIIAKILNNEESSYYIAKKLLEYYNREEIDKFCNEQKGNKILKDLYHNNNQYKEILKIDKWYDLLVNDTKHKPTIVEQVDLWD